MKSLLSDDLLSQEETIMRLRPKDAEIEIHKAQENRVSRINADWLSGLNETFVFPNVPVMTRWTANELVLVFEAEN